MEDINNVDLKTLILENEFLKVELEKLKNEKQMRLSAESAFKKSNLKYKMLFEESPFGIFKTDSKGSITEYNDLFFNILGFDTSVPDFTGNDRNLGDFMTPTDKIDFFDQLIHNRTQVFFEYHLAKTDGTTFLARIYAKAILDGGSILKSIFCFLEDITVDKLLESELFETEQKYRNIVELSPAGIVIHSDFKIVFCNQAAVNIIQCHDKVSLIGRNVLDFVHPDFLVIIKNRIKDYNPSERFIPPIEEKFIRYNGELFDVLVTASPIIYNGKKAMQVLFSEISDIKKIERELHKSKQFIHKIMEISPDIIYIWDMDLQKIIFCNPSICNIAGYTPEDFINNFNGIYQFVHDDDQIIIRDALSKLKSSPLDKPLNIEYRMKTLSGTYIWLSENITVFEKNARGIPTQILCIAEDITHQKKILKELQIRERNHRLISEIMSDFIYYYSLNADGCYKLEWIIGAYQKILGYDFNELSEIDWLTNLVDSSPDEVSKNFNRILNNESFVIEYKFLTKSGEIIWLRNYLKPVFDEKENRVTAFIGAVQEITENKNYQIQLLETAKELKLAVEQKDKFFSILAHDIRSYISGFLGLSDILETDIDVLTKKEIAYYSKNLHLSASNMFKLLENILEWSMIQRGLYSLNQSEFDINETIKSIVDSHSIAAVTKDITINYNSIPSLKYAGDLNIFSTVLRNILSNAIKYSYPGGAIIIKSFQENNNVIVTVEDNGIGMNQNLLNEMFQINANIIRDGTMNERGTGLGLILCNDLMNMIGGNIEAVSTEKSGTTFKLTFPLIQNK